jgi:hypothetical protein
LLLAGVMDEMELHLIHDTSSNLGGQYQML